MMENLSSFSVSVVTVHDTDLYLVKPWHFPKLICSLRYLHPLLFTIELAREAVLWTSIAV